MRRGITDRKSDEQGLWDELKRREIPPGCADREESEVDAATAK
jgi:hypothetical protein